MNYALINDGVVTNIIWLHPANAAEFESAVPMHDVPAEIGDTYVDGAFYRNGERILSSVENAQAEAAGMQDALEYLFGGDAV